MKKTLATIILFIFISSPVFAAAHLTYEETILPHIDMEESSSYFGGRLAVHENLLVRTNSASNSPKGKVSFYTSDLSGNYSYANTLSAGVDVSANVSFGKSLDTYKDLAIVGAPSSATSGSSRGKAFIFELQSGIFTQTDLIAKDDLTYNPSGLGIMHTSNFFGDAVAIYKDSTKAYAAVVDEGAEEIFVFEKTLAGGSWNLVFFYNTTSSPIHRSVISMNNQYITFASNAPSGKGSYAKVHILENTNLGWAFKETISAPSSSVNSHFSSSLDLSEDNNLAVGAWGHNGDGAVFIYELDGSSNFVLNDTLTNPVSPAPASSNFGYPISIYNDNLLVGNTDVSGTIGERKFYKYSKDSGVWTLEDTISAADTELSISDSTGFAQGLGIYESTVFASSYKDDSDGSSSTMDGSLFRFSIPSGVGPLAAPEFSEYILFVTFVLAGFAIKRRMPDLINSRVNLN